MLALSNEGSHTCIFLTSEPSGVFLSLSLLGATENVAIALSAAVVKGFC